MKKLLITLALFMTFIFFSSALISCSLACFIQCDNDYDSCVSSANSSSANEEDRRYRLQNCEWAKTLCKKNVTKYIRIINKREF